MPLENGIPAVCRVIDTADTKDIIDLYRDAGWWKDSYSDDFIPAMLQDSFRVVAAFNPAGEMIGMGRAISDGCSDAYIQDIVVRRDCRQAGIGSMIVAELLRQLKAADIDWVGLIAAPGTEKFYKTLGFEPMHDYIPMIYKTEKGNA